MTTAISQKIRSANVLMTLFIIALHTFAWDERMWPLRPLVNMAVPVFFVISSYLYFQKWSFTLSCYKKKLKSRFWSLYVPFIVYNLLYVPYIWLKVTVFHATDTRELIVGSIDMVTSGLFGYPNFPNPVLWYVWAVFVFAFFAPLMGWFVKRAKWSFPLLLVAVLPLSFLFPYTSVFYWLPCLLLGCFIAVYEGDVIAFVRKLSGYRWLVFFFLCYLFLFTYILKDEDVFSSLVYYIFRMSAPYFAICIYAICDNLLPQSFVKMVHPYTFPIYCLHVVFVNLSMQFILHYFAFLHFLLIQFSAFILAFSLVFLFCVMLSRIRPVWKILTGFRYS